jgi:cytidine deaminase
MTMTKEQLLQQALKAGDKVSAPRSRFKVGAALLASGGKLHQHCIIKNATYGLTSGFCNRMCNEPHVNNYIKDKMWRYIAAGQPTE